MSIIRKRNPRGYGEEFLLEQFTDLEKDHKINRSLISNYGKKLQRYYDDKKENDQKINDLSNILKDAKIESIRVLVSSEITVLANKNHIISNEIKLHEGHIDKMLLTQEKFMELYQKLESIGVLRKTEEFSCFKDPRE